MYDRRSSFENISSWVKEVQDNTDQDVLVYLVGNRIDLEENREVPRQEALSCMRQHGFHQLIETSALTGENVQEVFVSLTKHLYIANKNKLD
jgi:GTPase SAR1 family protein